MNKYIFSQDWFSGDIPSIKKSLAGFSNKKIHILEIGSFEGRSTVWFVENMLRYSDSKITCVDTFSGSTEHFREKIDISKLEDVFDHNIQVTGKSKQVKKLKGYSQELLRDLPLNSYEVIYIDGSHKGSDVLEDTILSFRLLKKGGIMLFDDYKWPGELAEIEKPKIAIDAFLTIFEGQYELLHKKNQVHIKKK